MSAESVRRRYDGAVGRRGRGGFVGYGNSCARSCGGLRRSVVAHESLERARLLLLTFRSWGDTLQLTKLGDIQRASHVVMSVPRIVRERVLDVHTLDVDSHVAVIDSFKVPVRMMNNGNRCKFDGFANCVS